MRSRKGFLLAITVLLLAPGIIALVPTRGDAVAWSAVVGLSRPVERPAQVDERTGGGDPASISEFVGAASSPALGLEATRARVAEDAIALRVVTLQKLADDRELAGAQMAVAELRDETGDVAETTVESAIANYRQTGLEGGLFDVDDLNSGLRANALGDAAVFADVDAVEEYRAKVKDLELAEQNLAAEAAENEQLGAEVSALSDRLASEQSWLAQLEEQHLQRNARIESAVASGWAQNLGRKQGFYLLTCPVDGAHNFIDSWGFPRSGGRRHKGVDILAAIGTPIVSPVSGRVEYRSNRVGGRSFHLFADDGNYFYGTHLSGYGDVQGEVRAGQVIGFVGDDGNAAGIPHLHFEIHPGGRGNPINPFVDSAAVCSGAQGS